MTVDRQNMDLEGVPLKTTLRLMLKQLGLAYCVRDGVLIISSDQGISEELEEAQSELESEDIGIGADEARRRPCNRTSLDHRQPLGRRPRPWGRGVSVMGSSIRKVAPWPGREVTEILPPCSRMIF